MKNKMRCAVCDGTSWVETGLHSKSNLIVCSNCGFCAHEIDATKEQEMINYYRTNYRKAPTTNNIITSSRKLEYVKIFLNEFFEDIKKAGRRITAFDIGSGIGFVPHLFSKMGHDAKGSELTTTFKRFASNIYGIELLDDIPEDKKYDLITCYHTLEHLMEPDKKLEKWISLLAPGGKIMIATPLFMGCLEENSGLPMQGFDHLYHENHINAFSVQSLKNLFSKCGLKIIKEDLIQYGQTYLLEKGDKKDIVKEDPQKQIDILKKQKDAMEKYLAGKFQDAIDAYPDFPEAYLALIFNTHGKDITAQKHFFEVAGKACPGNVRILAALSLWLYRNEDIESADRAFDMILKIKPNEELFYNAAINAHKMGNDFKALRMFEKSLYMNMGRWTECMEMMCRIGSRFDPVEVPLAKEEKAK